MVLPAFRGLSYEIEMPHVSYRVRSSPSRRSCWIRTIGFTAASFPIRPKPSRAVVQESRTKPSQFENYDRVAHCPTWSTPDRRWLCVGVNSFNTSDEKVNPPNWPVRSSTVSIYMHFVSVCATVVCLSLWFSFPVAPTCGLVFFLSFFLI